MGDKVGESKEDWSWRLTPLSFGNLQVEKERENCWGRRFSNYVFKLLFAQERPEVRRRVAEAAEEFGT